MPDDILSVVMPCLNAMPRIAEAIAAIRTTLPAEAHEIVVADGGSTDGTLEVLRSAGVVLLEGPDGSLYDGLNRAIARARGAHLVWANADDTMLPGMARLWRAARETGADMVTGEAEIHDGEGLLWTSDHHARRLDDASILFGVPTINARIVSRGLVERAGPFSLEVGLAADRLQMLRLARLADKRRGFSWQVYRYLSHAGSRTIAGSRTSGVAVHRANRRLAAHLMDGADPVAPGLAAAYAASSTLAETRLLALQGRVTDAFRSAASLTAGLRRPAALPTGLRAHMRYRGLGSGW